MLNMMNLTQTVCFFFLCFVSFYFSLVFVVNTFLDGFRLRSLRASMECTRRGTCGRRPLLSLFLSRIPLSGRRLLPSKKRKRKKIFQNVYQISSESNCCCMSCSSSSSPWPTLMIYKHLSSCLIHFTFLDNARPQMSLTVTPFFSGRFDRVFIGTQSRWRVRFRPSRYCRSTYSSSLSHYYPTTFSLRSSGSGRFQRRCGFQRTLLRLSPGRGRSSSLWFHPPVPVRCSRDQIPWRHQGAWFQSLANCLSLGEGSRFGRSDEVPTFSPFLFVRDNNNNIFSWDGRNIFPQGLPQQFSFICTFRTRKPPRTAWNIIRISDIRQRPQFQVTLNPRKTAIEFSITDFSGKLQTLVFRKAQVI